ncbi:ABC transporter ATP-binding protein [Tunturiibacter gelidoferens]|uniref:Phospholipid/cholesterol/gamma-HCH transport system ATP-binding protein n=1 Tax=Tunturiibacter gelidiferens TaxID=3069689 RepID=A0ACC5NW27_9BACT|nr:ATP-binding cassette domain-containing protein [Edaphobacter lichenicola]MBB5338797.1 phospholipid/cholesterol/gamma-HCH transport system ATP-binding protein [Edaphobacter lichenicola]
MTADLAQSGSATLQQQPDSQEPIVVVDDVSIIFDVKPVLQNVSFTVQRGETRIILGPAGGGKSVLMKLVNGLLCPDTGSIKVFGEDVSTMPETDLFKLRGRIGMVFQESALFDSLSVGDNVSYRLHEDRIPEEEVHTRVLEALRFVELENTIEKFPSELSGGMRRRVSIARAIITNPDLILYDSPTGGLDPITSTTIIDLVIKQRDVTQTTSLVITHRIQDAYLLARSRFNTQTGKVEQIPNNGIDDSTKFLVLNEGKVVFDGTTEELVHSNDPWLKEYLS